MDEKIDQQTDNKVIPSKTIHEVRTKHRKWPTKGSLRLRRIFEQIGTIVYIAHSARINY